MTRRLLGALICALLLSAATFDAYSEAAQTTFSTIFEFETSFISLDSLDDFGDSSFPGRSLDWSPREKVVAKLMLGTALRRIKLAPAAVPDGENVVHSRETFRDLFRFQEVYRI